MSAGRGAAPEVVSVAVSKLRDLPVHARTVSGPLARLLAGRMASGGGAGPVTAGRVAGRLYPVDDLETVAGLRESGARRTRAVVTGYRSMADLLAAHVERNLHPHGVDPLKLRQMAEYLAGTGMRPEDACRVLAIDGRPELHAALAARISDAARDVMLGMLDEVSARVDFAVTPAYYVRLLGRISPGEQEAAALELKAVTMPRMLSNEGAVWPSPEMVRTVLSKFHPDARVPPAAERVSEIGPVGDLNKRPAPARPGAAAAAAEDASNYIAGDPNLLYVPLDGHPDLILNKRTGRVAVAKEGGGTYALVDDLGRTAHVLPGYVARYLDRGGSESPLVVTKYPSMERASAALSRARDRDRRCVIISDAPLPRR